MYYHIGSEFEKVQTDLTNLDHMVCVFTYDEFESKKAELGLNFYPKKPETNRFCKAEVHKDYIAGTFSIPEKKDFRKRKNFSYYIQGSTVLFIDDSGTAADIIQKIVKTKPLVKPSVEQFLYDFLESLIENDLIYLEEIEKRLIAMEDAVLSGVIDHFNHKMSPCRRELLNVYNYYSQIMEIGHELRENENGFFEKENLFLFRLFTVRVERLLSNTLMLREYSMQVREVYQTQVDIRQNKIMKILTVVTAIFLPLSLIAGWYGMNFKNMPELAWEYGYLAVIVFSAAVVFICIWLFKKKKFL